MVERRKVLEFCTECMFPKHMPEVLSIEREKIEHVWTEADFVRFLRPENCLGRVIRIGEKVVGYAVYKLYKRRLHLFNFVVASAYRRRGIGTQLMSALLMENFSSNKHVMVTLNVRSSNFDGQLFYKSYGFEDINVLRRFYGSEDAYRLVYYRDPIVYSESVGI